MYCKRENRHRFSVKRVLVDHYTGPSAGYEYKALCGKCGKNNDWWDIPCK